MTPVPGLATRLARLRAEVATDLAALLARAEEMAGLVARWPADARTLDRRDLVVGAVVVHAWYTALETLLERVARLLDESTPTGAAWHAELVSQMSVEVPGLRGAVIDGALGPDLAELRKFRHFFRNAYVLTFDADRVHEHGQRLLRVHPQVRGGVERLLAHIEALQAEVLG
jgi:hypothetical protein